MPLGRSPLILRVAVAGALAVTLPAACTGSDPGPEAAASPTTARAPSLSTPAPTTTTTERPTAPVPTEAVVRALTAEELVAAQAQLIEAPDCPVGFDQLRVVEVPFWSFDGTTERGTLILNADVATQLGDLFVALHRDRFPIQRMDAIDPLPVDDQDRRSSNNTVGFKCRAVRGGSTWSQHAYGHAVDINPVDNPSVTDGLATPPLGADRVDRSQRHPGTIHEGDAVTRAFDELGWGWGGRWSSHQDYMHFSLTGG